MRLIDAPVGVFRFNGELVLKTEYMSEVDGVWNPDCYILSSGEKFWGGMKTAEDFKTKYNNLEVEPIDVQPEQKWIPCSERLPEEDGGLYLVTDYAKSVNRRRVHVSRCYMNKDGFWSDVPLGYKVIAWMPLPEPYAERRTE